MINNSKVLALKYRPQLFEDLIGQDIIADTIFNSIKENKVPNAYLFTGIRGVGKTTTARIIAKSLNCLNGIEKICKEELCENCSAITNSNHIDVLEMDAASKTGVDDVRDLIEFSRYGPTTAKYKIFIIDEVHMLSKQAFNALLKTLEEPPEYLKFIFATTEIKKIPITVVSRCQRFDLSRVKSNELFEFIKKIKDKEKGKINDEALKLIVKISEGSVRDALSLLDRALLSLNSENELNLLGAQKIFGYFDKSKLINLLELIFQGNEKKVLNMYRSIYDQGIEPKIFLNDFLEILYYFKNINSLKIEGTNFSLNDEEFNTIKEISKNISTETLILFWQFSIKTLGELDIVSNQNLSIEMFLIRLMHLSGFSSISKPIGKSNTSEEISINKENEISINNIENENDDLFDLKNKTIGQIKNINQEKQPEQNIKNNENHEQSIIINSFDDLLKICTLKKEIKLKYELEKNVNLVSFEKKRIEISFNENLDKEFIKTISLKLYEWTGDRWIITLSKKKGSISIKEKEKFIKKNNLDKVKKRLIYKDVMESFPDAELIDIENKELEND
jgi:DNA polymerase III subunit gamma/tau